MGEEATVDLDWAEGRACPGIGRRRKTVAFLYVSSYIYGVRQLGPLFRRSSVLARGHPFSVRVFLSFQVIPFTDL